MNEVTRIHLGRQAFTIAADAHKELREYVTAIKKHVGANEAEVVEEVELRMAELLHERGITGEKVVLQKDVVYLKEQLGSPKDFADEDAADTPEGEEAFANTQPRQLFRDTENGKLGGVAAGLAAYFGIDATWARIGFIVLTLAWGGGIILYLLLWLIVPEAKTGSDYLRLHGKPITVDTIKEFVDQTDVPDKAKRARSLLAQIVTGISKLAIFCAGLILAGVAVFGMVWTIAFGIYAFIQPDRLFDAGRIFPIDTQDYWLLILILMVTISIFGMLFIAGISLMRRKWAVPNWVTASLAVIAFAGTAVAIPFGAATAPQVRDRYKAAEHHETRELKPFTSLEITGSETVVRYEPAENYSLEIKSVGPIDEKAIKTEIQETGTLAIDTGNFRGEHGCTLFCIATTDVELTIKAPKLDKVTLQNDTVFKLDKRLRQTDMTIETQGTAQVRMHYINPTEAVLTTNNPWESKTLVLKDLHPDAQREDVLRNTDLAGFILTQSGSLKYDGSYTCEEYDPIIYLDSAPQTIQIGEQKFTNEQDFMGTRSYDKNSRFNCVIVR